MTRYSSPARRTIAILRSLCDEVGLDPTPYIERLCNGFDHYGEHNHLLPGFALATEWTPETQDNVNFPALGVSRGEIDRDDPDLLIYMQAAAVMAGAQARLLAKLRVHWDADDHDA